jgi:hypothetical protein
LVLTRNGLQRFALALLKRGGGAAPFVFAFGFLMADFAGHAAMPAGAIRRSNS